MKQEIGRAQTKGDCQGSLAFWSLQLSCFLNVMLEMQLSISVRYWRFHLLSPTTLLISYPVKNFASDWYEKNGKNKYRNEWGRSASRYPLKPLASLHQHPVVQGSSHRQIFSILLLQNWRYRVIYKIPLIYQRSEG